MESERSNEEDDHHEHPPPLQQDEQEQKVFCCFSPADECCCCVPLMNGLSFIVYLDLLKLVFMIILSFILVSVNQVPSTTALLMLNFLVIFMILQAIFGLYAEKQALGPDARTNAIVLYAHFKVFIALYLPLTMMGNFVCSTRLFGVNNEEFSGSKHPGCALHGDVSAIVIVLLDLLLNLYFVFLLHSFHVRAYLDDLLEEPIMSEEPMMPLRVALESEDEDYFVDSFALPLGKVYGFPVLSTPHGRGDVILFGNDENNLDDLEGVEMRRLRKGKFRRFSTVLNRKKMKMRDAAVLRLRRQKKPEQEEQKSRSPRKTWKESQPSLDASRYARGGEVLFTGRTMNRTEDDQKETARELLTSRNEIDVVHVRKKNGEKIPSMRRLKKQRKSVASSHSSFVSVYDLTDTRRLFRKSTKRLDSRLSLHRKTSSARSGTYSVQAHSCERKTPKDDESEDGNVHLGLSQSRGNESAVSVMSPQLRFRPGSKVPDEKCSSMATVVLEP